MVLAGRVGSVTMIGPAAKVVVRYADGRLVKGYTYDFEGRGRFHVFPTLDASSDPTPVLVAELKAVFLVRDLVGNARYDERKRFSDTAPPPGRRVEITFKDGEVLVGSTRCDIGGGPGVFLVPADPASNNLRVYAVATAIHRIRDLPVGHPTALPAGTAGRRPRLPQRALAWLQQPLMQPGPRLQRGPSA
jgi:Family of unknown function (DUF6982)